MTFYNYCKRYNINNSEPNWKPEPSTESSSYVNFYIHSDEYTASKKLGVLIHFSFGPPGQMMPLGVVTSEVWPGNYWLVQALTLQADVRGILCCFESGVVGWGLTWGYQVRVLIRGEAPLIL